MGWVGGLWQGNSRASVQSYVEKGVNRQAFFTSLVDWEGVGWLVYVCLFSNITRSEQSVSETLISSWMENV